MSGSHNIKLTFDQRQTIAKLHASGTTVVALSEQFGVSRPTVYKILEKMEKKVEKEPYSIISTNLLGIIIDTKNGPTHPKINKALNASFKLLDITKFIEITEFKLNMVMFDYFWQIVVGQVTGLHVSTSILQWFGYTGEYKAQKDAFLRILKRNNISYQELTQKDKKIEMYPTIQEELQLIPSNVKHSKFLIMEPDDLKMAIMQLKTKNGNTIRQYYIDLEKLLKMYTEYTLYFNYYESNRKISTLEESMSQLNLTISKQEQIMIRQEQYMHSLGISLEEVKDQNDELLDKTTYLTKQNTGLQTEVKKVQYKLGIAVEDRAPLPLDEDKQERFVLIKRNNNEYYPYYTIRAQYKYTERRIKTQKVLFPNLEVLLDFKANPNSKSLYTRIKDELKAKGVQFNGNNIDLEESEVTEKELMEEMKVINDQKYNV
ncbi:hypothetical protein IIV30_057R [Invertebrate iridescent virus 30]|uniref:Uncharacterized protein n=1 Tax=Invertebrate iridescent virus 30 TaxID=345585 RepID=W8W1Q4_9VIRU|nr:hypothetical protein IIV30_057R [Invertebrate iridescent virus 30]CCV02252.1 hypothetical protein IIV30_057R [Invertebrate iridescent virus 30]